MADYRNILTDTIYQLESSSGKNRSAYRPNSVGALGGFQLTPGAFKDIQKLNPQTWGNMRFQDVAMDDKLSREAAFEYLVALTKQLEHYGAPVNNVNLLGAYHSGAKNVSRGTLGPQGLDYISRARVLAGVRPGEEW